MANGPESSLVLLHVTLHSPAARSLFHRDLVLIAPVLKMRLLKTLAFASGVVALATGPVQPLADQQTVQGDASLKPEDAVVASPE